MSTWITIFVVVFGVIGGFVGTMMLSSRYSRRNAKLAAEGKLEPYSPRAKKDLEEYYASLSPEERRFEKGEGWAHE